MKKVLPVALIIAVAILSTTPSCKKKASNTCTCTERGSKNQDTVVSFSTVDSGYTNVSDECTAGNALLKLDSARYGCHM